MEKIEPERSTPKAQGPNVKEKMIGETGQSEGGGLVHEVKAGRRDAATGAHG